MLLAFNAASQSSIADPRPAQEAIPLAHREHPHQPANSLAARARSTLHAPRQAATQVPAAQEPAVPERDPDLAHAPDLEDHLVPAGSAGLVPADRAEAHHLPARRRARSALLPAEAAVDGRSIRRLKKAQ